MLRDVPDDASVSSTSAGRSGTAPRSSAMLKKEEKEVRGGEPASLPPWDFEDAEHPHSAASTVSPPSFACSSFVARAGWLVSCALLDPGAVEGALQSGAYVNYSLIWVTLWTTVMVFAFQSLAARIGVVSGQSLAHAFRSEYKSRFLSFVVWAFMEISVIGDDLQALIGSSLALNLMFGLPFYASILLTIVFTLALTFFYYRKPSMIEALVGSLMFTMTVCYMVNVAYARPPAGQVLYGMIVPTAPNYATLQLVGSIGGILTPSTLFLGSQIALAHPVNRLDPDSVRWWSRYATGELSTGFALTFLANLFIIATFAVGFFNADCAESQTALVNGNCTSIGLEDAPYALESLYGQTAKYLFGVALFFSGQNSMVSATLAGQATFEGFADRKIPFWVRLIVTRIITLVPTLILAFTAGTTQVTYSTANQWVNIIMALIIPFAMIPVVHLASLSKIMGDHAIGLKTTAVFNAVILLVISINFYLLFGFLYDPLDFGSVGSFSATPSFYTFVGAVMFFYALLLLQLSLRTIMGGWETLIQFKRFQRCGKEQDDVSDADESATTLPTTLDLPTPLHSRPAPPHSAAVVDQDEAGVAIV